MKKVVAVALAFIAIAFVLDLLGVHGRIARVLYLSVGIASISYAASREYGWWGRRPPT